MTRLAPYGSEALAGTLAKVGKNKTPRSLAARMPSPGIASKVGAPRASHTPDEIVRIVRRKAGI